MNQAINVITSPYGSPYTSFSPFMGFESMEAPSDSSALSSYSVMSPNLSILDHQEIVETETYNPPISVTHSNEIVNTGHSGIQVNDSWDSSYLFSFELDTNGLSKHLVEPTDQSLPDFDWCDLLESSNVGPVELDDIQVTRLSTPIQKNNPNKDAIVDEAERSPASGLAPSSARLVDNKQIHPIESSLSLRSRKEQMLPRLYPPRFFEPRTLEVDNESDSETQHGSLSAGFSPSLGERCLNNEDLARGKPGQKISLSLEEKKMLHSMGMRLPTRFPLNRVEEKALRSVRRRIRNKLSAQASRLRRQEYVSDLEYRMQLSDRENGQLRDRISSLECDKRDLMSHVRKLRAYLSKVLNRCDQPSPLPLFVRTKLKAKRPTSQSSTSPSASTTAAGGTSLLIVVFMVLAWTAWVPNSLSGQGKPGFLLSQTDRALSLFPGRSRTLLENNVAVDIAANAKEKSRIAEQAPDITAVDLNTDKTEQFIQNIPAEKQSTLIHSLSLSDNLSAQIERFNDRHQPDSDNDPKPTETPIFKLVTTTLDL